MTEKGFPDPAVSLLTSNRIMCRVYCAPAISPDHVNVAGFSYKFSRINKAPPQTEAMALHYGIKTIIGGAVHYMPTRGGSGIGKNQRGKETPVHAI